MPGPILTPTAEAQTGPQLEHTISSVIVPMRRIGSKTIGKGLVFLAYELVEDG